MKNHCLRISDETVAAIEVACNSNRMNFSCFCRQAIDEKLKREPRISDALWHISTELQTIVAFLDKLVLSIFTCVPEPADLDLARSVARRRQEKFLQSVALAIEKNGNGIGHKSVKGVD